MCLESRAFSRPFMTTVDNNGLASALYSYFLMLFRIYIYIHVISFEILNSEKIPVI